MEDDGECVPIECEVGFELIGNECVPIVCEVGFVLVGNDCVPIECEEGFELIGNDCVPIVCEEGFELVGNDCIPIECDEGFELIGNECQPIECPTGTILIGNECIPIECDEGFELIGNECIPIECPTGFELVGNECLPIECPEGTILVGNTCEPIECPEGTILVQNECVPIECPTGTILVGNDCVVVECEQDCEPIECPEGTELIGDECVELPPVECDEGQVLVDEVCVLIECDEGFELIGNECIEEPKAKDNNEGGGGATPPTLGVNTNSNILQVEGGFTCNNQTVDVNYWFTPFPQISLNVGDKLVCDFKIFDEHNGWDNVAHFDFALGKQVGETMSTEYGKLSLDIDQVTREQTVTFDESEFYNVVFVASEEPVICLEGQDAECLAVHLEFNSRIPFTDDKVVGTQVWNYQRSVWSNYYNEGIEVVGDTMNELPIYSLAGRDGKLYDIQLTDKTLQNTRLAVNLDTGESGLIIKDRFVSTEPVIVKSASDSVTERHGSAFKLVQEWHNNQVLKFAMELYPNVYDEPYEEINDIFSYVYPKRN